VTQAFNKESPKRHSTGNRVSQSYLSGNADRGVVEVKQNHTEVFTPNIRKFIRRGALHAPAARYCRTPESSFLSFKPIQNACPKRLVTSEAEGQSRAERFEDEWDYSQRRFSGFIRRSGVFAFWAADTSLKIKVLAR